MKNDLQICCFCDSTTITNRIRLIHTPVKCGELGKVYWNLFVIAGESSQPSTSDCTSTHNQLPSSSSMTSSCSRPRKSYKVKQYLTERYESDLESPGPLTPLTPSLASRTQTSHVARNSSVDSPSFDDVFSPSPGVFSKQRAVFTFSPERDAELRRAASAFAASKARKYNPSPLSLAPAAAEKGGPGRVPSQGRPGSSFDDPETPVFYSPAVALTPSSSKSAPGTSVFQFNTPLARHAAAVEQYHLHNQTSLPYHNLRSHIPVSPLAVTSSRTRQRHSAPSPRDIPRNLSRDLATSQSSVVRPRSSDERSTSVSLNEPVTSPMSNSKSDAKHKRSSPAAMQVVCSNASQQPEVRPPVPPTIFASLSGQPVLVPPLMAMLRHPTFAHAPTNSTEDTPSPPVTSLPPFQTYLSQLAKTNPGKSLTYSLSPCLLFLKPPVVTMFYWRRSQEHIH